MMMMMTMPMTMTTTTTMTMTMTMMATMMATMIIIDVTMQKVSIYDALTSMSVFFRCIVCIDFKKSFLFSSSC